MMYSIKKVLKKAYRNGQSPYGQTQMLRDVRWKITTTT